ncbi:calcium-binding protein [Pseudooceanicola sp.]|uniref:calcium-binding protein n=1 Tax=Pseudooceanicola sp. TaxID=1914328 RepID=UPI003514DE0A
MTDIRVFDTATGGLDIAPGPAGFHIFYAPGLNITQGSTLYDLAQGALAQGATRNDIEQSIPGSVADTYLLAGSDWFDTLVVQTGGTVSNRSIASLLYMQGGNLAVSITDLALPATDSFAGDTQYLVNVVPLDGNGRIRGSATFSDRIRAGDGADRILGYGGDDTLRGEAGDDRINGGSGADSIFGGSGDDRIDGGSGTDDLLGQAGDDQIFGGAGKDRIEGGKGDDNLNGAAGHDRILGGAGTDSIGGGAGNDSVNGNGGDDLIDGGDGEDVLSGGGGNDTLYGGNNADMMSGGAGRDLLEGEDGADAMAGGAGQDTLKGGAGADRLFGGNGFDRLFGGASADTLKGDLGKDRLVGGAGSDKLTGGKGNDVLGGGGGADSFFFAQGDGQDRIFDFDPLRDEIWIQRPGLGFDDLDITGSLGDTIIDYGGDTIILEDVQASSINAGIFTFG